MLYGLMRQKDFYMLYLIVVLFIILVIKEEVGCRVLSQIKFLYILFISKGGDDCQ